MTFKETGYVLRIESNEKEQLDELVNSLSTFASVFEIPLEEIEKDKAKAYLKYYAGSPGLDTKFEIESFAVKVKGTSYRATVKFMASHMLQENHYFSDALLKSLSKKFQAMDKCELFVNDSGSSFSRTWDDNYKVDLTGGNLGEYTKITNFKIRPDKDMLPTFISFNKNYTIKENIVSRIINFSHSEDMYFSDSPKVNMAVSLNISLDASPELLEKIKLDYSSLDWLIKRVAISNLLKSTDITLSLESGDKNQFNKRKSLIFQQLIDNDFLNQKHQSLLEKHKLSLNLNAGQKIKSTNKL